MPGVSYNGSTCVRGGSFADPDTTPFYMETVVDSGVGFYHVMIGDPASAFSQEYYIAFASTSTWNGYFNVNSSAGTYNGGAGATYNSGVTFYSPLDSNPLHSGNATGNPGRVIFSQTIKGTGFDQTITKSSFPNQPVISQHVNDSELTSTWGIDMSANTYTTMSATPGVLTNTMSVTDTVTGQAMMTFDQGINSQNSYVDGGRVLYANGTGPGASNGVYTYATGVFDAHTVEWQWLWDAAVNVP